MLFFFYINSLAMLIFLAISSMITSPEVKVQKVRITKFSQKYHEVSNKIDSLIYVLKGFCFTNDQVYRDILELDSISQNIRLAGTGGYVPYVVTLSGDASKVYSVIFIKMDNLKSQIRIQKDSYSEILNEAILRNRKLEQFPGITPVKFDENVSISSYFGSRDDPFTLNLARHTGIDIVDTLNTKIYATAKGTVTFAELSRTGYGNEIIIDHGFGYSTIYGHLNKILVEKGQKVIRGEFIGLMGNTGRSTGTHLHYEVRYYNEPVNPMNFFADNITPEEFEKLTNLSD